MECATQSFVYTVLGVAFSPFIICVGLVIILASSGQSLGLRKLGLNILIKIFEFVAQKIRDDELHSSSLIIDRREGAAEEVEEEEKKKKTVVGTPTRRRLPPPDIQIDAKQSFYISEDEASAKEEDDDNDDAFSPSSVSASPALRLRGHARTLSADAGLIHRGSDDDGTTDAATPSFLNLLSTSGGGGGGSSNTAHIIDRELYNPKEFAETVVIPEWHQQQRHQQHQQQQRQPQHQRLPRVKSLRSLKRDFQLSDVTSFAKAGVEAIIEDQVTSRFRAEELTTWNLLTRTNQNYQFRSKRLCAFWAAGFFVRYFILFPFRLTLALFGLGLLIVLTAVIGYLPSGPLKQTLNRYFSLVCYRILSRSFSAIITYHNRENMARPKGICVANHTTPIDVVVLSCDNCYAMVGQSHGGFLGVMQKALHRATDHIWFERSEVNDRLAVSRRLREHVEDSTKLPILIFPEGTCINNTSVMMFKKGSFEVGGTIHPVAIKYHPEFGDAFWNSSEQSMVTYIIMMMTSWAIVVDIWYLPEMTRAPGEDAIAFANRVKSEICRQGGLVDLDWDGMLKRQKPKASLLAQAQQDISRTFSFASQMAARAEAEKATVAAPVAAAATESGELKCMKADESNSSGDVVSSPINITSEND